MPRRPDLARRAELATAAFEVLRARGMQTSMRELADALGVKRPTLYFYFPDLAAVFDSVNAQFSSGAMSRPKLTWSRGFTRRKFGHYNHVQDSRRPSSPARGTSRTRSIACAPSCTPRSSFTGSDPT